MGDPPKNKPWFNPDNWDDIKANLRAEGIEPFPFITPDFNFSAKFYAAWLRWLFAYIKILEEAVNQLLKRELKVSDTEAIDMSQDGDWTSEDVITIKSVLVLSDLIKHLTIQTRDFDAQNANTIESDGLYAPDYKAFIEDIYNEIDNINNTLNIIGGSGKPVTIDPGDDDRLINGIQLPDNLDPNSNILIAYRYGSTSLVATIKVSSLKGAGSGHITAINGNDSVIEFQACEAFTHITSSNVLRINAIRQLYWNVPDNVNTSANEVDLTPYWSNQFSDYRNQINGQNLGITVDSVTYYVPYEKED